MIRIGTRGSKLALWQANWVQSSLTAAGIPAELMIISTTGDISTKPLSEVGGQGLFTKEIQRELLAERVDVAVHSLKDLPTIPVPGLTLAAVPKRETTEDCLISREHQLFEDLPAGARIGTGSLRRQSQLRAWRKDIVVEDIRGNVDSRLRKLHEGEFDAIILAAAGLTRLGLSEHITQRLPQQRMLPAVGQGALGLECRAEDARVLEALAVLNDAASHAAVAAERSLLSSLLAGCLAPVAALAQVEHDQLILAARVLSRCGEDQIDASESGRVADAVEIGVRLASRLAAAGATRLIDEARRS